MSEEKLVIPTTPVPAESKPVDVSNSPKIPPTLPIQQNNVPVPKTLDISNNVPETLR